MSDDHANPNDLKNDPGSRIAIALFSLIFALSPGLIIANSLHRAGVVPISTILFCAIVSIGGGIGSLIGVKNRVTRVLGGIFLGLFLLLLSTGIGIGLACAQEFGNL